MAVAGKRAKLGAIYLGKNHCSFTVWAPLARQVELHLLVPRDQIIPLVPLPRGYHQGVFEDIPPGARYMYRLHTDLAETDGREYPDPASRSQPEGVHGPSEVVDPYSFEWQDDHWFNVAQQDLIIYELHIGAFTAEGTFEAAIPYLPYLKELGVTAVEIMPVAQFPGARNWGYDGVYLFASQNSYGGPDGLRRLVNACHRHGLALILDAVYNHLGPEGNYLSRFGPYFTSRYQTPWGDAFNLDGAFSDSVRELFIENAIHWIEEYHIDGLRLDAIDWVRDVSAHPFLEHLAGSTHFRAERLGRRFYLIGEIDLNDSRVVLPRSIGGYSLDGQWIDDFHHILHVLLTGEKAGYFEDYGGIPQMAKAVREGYVYTGQYSSYRKHSRGNSSALVSARQFVAFSQNHDQVGNRLRGERLSHLVSLESAKLAAAVVLLSPYLPLIFMGEEYAEKAPFRYFMNHSDPELVEAVRKGRLEECALLTGTCDEEPPDPSSEETFRACRLDHSLRGVPPHSIMLQYYKELIRLRKSIPALNIPDKENLEVIPLEDWNSLLMRRWAEGMEVFAIFNFSECEASVACPLPAGVWTKMLDSAEARWGGEGSPAPKSVACDGMVHCSVAARSAVLFARIEE